MIRASARAQLVAPARAPAAPRSAPRVKAKFKPDVAAAALHAQRPVAPAPALTAARVSREAHAAPVAPRQAAPKAASRPAAVATPAAPARAYSVVPTPTTPAKGKKKSVEQKSVEIFGVLPKEATVPKATKKTPSLLNKLTQPKMLCLIGALGALKVAFAVLAVKVGPLAATSLVAQHAVAFLTPGIYMTIFALEVALKLTTTVIAHGILPIVLPILSTIVVTTLAVGLTAYIAYRAADAALDILPGGGTIRYLATKIFNKIFFKEQPEQDQAKSMLSRAGTFMKNSITNFFTSPKDVVEGDGDADGSDDESSDEEIVNPRSIVERRLDQQMEATKVSTESRIRAELGDRRPVVRELKGFESLLEAAEDAPSYIATRYKSIQI